MNYKFKEKYFFCSRKIQRPSCVKSTKLDSPYKNFIHWIQEEKIQDHRTARFFQNPMDGFFSQNPRSPNSSFFSKSNGWCFFTKSNEIQRERTSSKPRRIYSRVRYVDSHVRHNPVQKSKSRTKYEKMACTRFSTDPGPPTILGSTP